jgi:phosphoribosyl 1,2-cyclic phosphodiesterase
MQMQICSIASGSDGNCTYVGDGKHHILIDAGISRKRIVEGLQSIHVKPEQLDAIFVTHEHTDHIQGIPMMVKYFHVPVYGTAGTLDGIRRKDTKHMVPMENMFQIYADKPVRMGNMTVMPFHTSHDAAEPVCYTIQAAGHKASIVTDLGVYDDYTVSHLVDSEVLLLEANHDVSMLEAGTYPYSLKCRILSEIGHLSNEASGSLLCRLLHDRISHIFLAHLSRENNYPELAYETVKCRLWEEMGMTRLPFALSVAKRKEPSELVEL